MGDLESIVQFFPMNRVSAGLYGPAGSLFRRGRSQPLQPSDFVRRQAYQSAVAELNVQYIFFKLDVG